MASMTWYSRKNIFQKVRYRYLCGPTVSPSFINKPMHIKRLTEYRLLPLISLIVSDSFILTKVQPSIFGKNLRIVSILAHSPSAFYSPEVHK